MGNLAKRLKYDFIRVVALRLHLSALAACAVALSPATAKDKGPEPTSRLVQSLLACRDLPDDAARLRCFDRETGAIAAALGSKDVVMLDRTQIEQAKRDDFGSRRPPRDLPVPANVDAATLTSIDSTVTRATQAGDGGWIVTLKDGSVWRQTDDTPIGSSPRAGEAVTVRRAALGTFKLKVGKRPAMRVRRTA